MTPEEAAVSYYISMRSFHHENVSLENSTTVAINLKDINSKLRLKDVSFLSYRFFNNDVLEEFPSFLDLELNFHDENGKIIGPRDDRSSYFYINNPGELLTKFL